MKMKIFLSIILIILLTGSLYFVGKAIFNQEQESLIELDTQHIYDDESYILFFYLETCPHCHNVKAVLPEYRSQSSVKVYEIEAYSLGKELAQQYGIKDVPAMFYVEDGKVLRIVVGDEDCIKLLNEIKNRN